MKFDFAKNTFKTLKMDTKTGENFGRKTRQ